MRAIALAILGRLVWTRRGDAFLRRHHRIDRYLERYVTRAAHPLPVKVREIKVKR